MYIFCWDVVHLVFMRRFGFQKYSNKYYFSFSELLSYRLVFNVSKLGTL